MVCGLKMTLDKTISLIPFLTSVNNFSFSACRTCVSFFAEAKGDSIMWVGAGCKAFLARCREDEVEAEQEGCGLSSSSSSSSIMILSAIEAGATAIQNVGYFCFHKKQGECWSGQDVKEAVGQWILEISQYEICSVLVEHEWCGGCNNSTDDTRSKW